MSPKGQCTHFINYPINILKIKKGVLSQSVKDDYHMFHKKKLSSKAKDLLKKIENNSPRYENIDRIVKKYST
jgi:hypothetical protein